MNARRLLKLGPKIYGPLGWKGKLAKRLEVHPSTLRRWIERDEVPGPAAVAIEELARVKARS